MKILVIEDEKSLSDFMEKGLQQAGYAVSVYCDGMEGLKQASKGDFDLILLDLMLPGMNGFDILNNLQSLEIQIPVIIISALSDTEQVVKGLNMGAVDYIKKPFDWEELLARIRIVQKKSIVGKSSKIHVEDLTIDLIGRTVIRAGKEIRLTAKEFLLLEYLARNANRIVSKIKLWNMFGIWISTREAIWWRFIFINFVRK